MAVLDWHEAPQLRAVGLVLLFGGGQDGGPELAESDAVAVALALATHDDRVAVGDELALLAIR